MRTVRSQTWRSALEEKTRLHQVAIARVYFRSAARLRDRGPRRWQVDKETPRSCDDEKATELMNETELPNIFVLKTSLLLAVVASREGYLRVKCSREFSTLPGMGLLQTLAMERRYGGPIFMLRIARQSLWKHCKAVSRNDYFLKNHE